MKFLLIVLLLTPSVFAEAILEEPSLGARKVADLPKGTPSSAIEEKWTVDPGEGVIEGTPYLKSVPQEEHSKFKSGTHIKIFEYTGEGYSQIELDGKRFSTKVVRSFSHCKKGKPTQWRECWVKVLKEPSYIRWKKVRVSDSVTGWVLEEKLLANRSLHLPGQESPVQQ